MARRPLIALILAVGLAGCATAPETQVRTKKVKVPIPERRDPPERLRAPDQPPPAPQFVPLDHPDAKTALTADGIEAFQLLLDHLISRRDAWRAFVLNDEAPE